MPWFDTEPDEEFIQFVKNFKDNNNPQMKAMIDRTKGKDIHIFTSRQMATKYLEELRTKCSLKEDI